MSDQESGRRFAIAMTLGSLQTGAVLITSLASVKLTAIYIGPAGLAMVSQMQSLLQICNGVIGATLGTAVMRLGSQYGLGSRFSVLIRTCVGIAVYSGLSMILVTFVFSKAIWRIMYGDIIPFLPAILAIGFGAFAGMLQSVIASAMNSINEATLVSGSRVLAACAALFGYSGAMILWGVHGALVGVGIGAVLQCVAVYCMMRTRSSTKPYFTAGQWSTSEFRAVIVFMPMMVANSVADPLAMILMREHLLTTVSAHTTGILQASYRLAEVTMTILTAGVSLYLLPRLGALTDNLHALRNEVRRIIIYITAIAAILGSFVFLFRNIIVVSVFSRDFIQVADLMALQMFWFLFKSVTWVCGAVLVAQVRHTAYIVLQFMGPALFLAFLTQLQLPGPIANVVLASSVAAGIQLTFSLWAIRDLVFISSTKRAVK